LGDGEPPAPEDIRVEDFLAAVDYQFAPAEQGLALRTAAGPSTFTILPGQQPADGLLQVGVKAGEVLRSEPGGVHLIVALDASANMRWRGRIEICKQGLRRALAHLEPQDRFSLVAFDGQVVSAVENLSLAQIDEGYRLLDELQPHGGTNLAEGLRHAISLGLSESERSARVLLMTDGPGEMPRRLTDVVHGMLRSAAADGVTLSVIEMSDEPEIDSHLEQLAVEGAGLFYRASTSQHVRWTAVETLVGRSSLVAADARLEVTFNPNAVEAYRLLGHERTELVSDSEPTITADLHSDEEATALYQVWLKPGGDDNVATARLHWIDPASGKPRSSTQSITRVQFALSFERSPLSLQAAAIAAEAAEVLRESPFVASRSRSLANVLALAGRANPKLAERPAFRDFIGMLENAERVRIRPGVSPFRE
jgi:Ca-activated chloride channel family protein